MLSFHSGFTGLRQLALLFLSAWAISCAICSAQDAAPASAPAEPAPGQKLRVVTRLVDPFVMERNGDLYGYSIELWRQVAAKAKLDYEFQIVKTVPEMIQALEQDKADVGVAALTINAKREKTIGFSHPFYQSGLKIAVSGNGSSGFLSVLGAFFSKDFLLVLLLVLGLLLLAGVLVWFLERKRNEESFPNLTEAMWYSLNVIIAGGCENKSPVSLGGRAVATAWMLISLVLVSSFTATITSTLTVSNLSGDIRGVSDLPGKAVGTIEGTSAATYLKDHNITAKYYPDLRAALDALQKKQLQAVVYDAPILMYLAKQLGNSIQLVPALFDRQAYGFGLQNNTNALRKQINVALLSLTEEGVLDELDNKWFGDGEE